MIKDRKTRLDIKASVVKARYQEQNTGLNGLKMSYMFSK